MIRLFTTVTALAFAVACNKPAAERTGEANSDQPSASRSAANNTSAGTANAPSQIAGVAPGQQVRAVRDAPCAEVGPGASDEPWDVKQGSVGNLVKVEGATTLIDTGSGLPCRIATDALAPV